MRTTSPHVAPFRCVPRVARLSLALVLALASLLFVGSAAAQTPPDRDSVAPPGQIRVVEALSLSPTSPQVGETVTATFKIRNIGSRAATIRELTAAVVPAVVPMQGGMGVRPVPVPGPALDFPHVATLTLQPGEEYRYSRSRSFPAAGAYSAWPAAQLVGRGLMAIPGGNRVAFTVKRPLPAGLRMVEPLKLSSTSLKPGQVVTASFKVKNVGSQPLAVQELFAAVRPTFRPPGLGLEPMEPAERPALLLDFPAVKGLTLEPGGEYLYEQSRSFAAPGSFFAEPMASLDGRLIPVAGGNRVAFTVTRPMPGRLVVMEPLKLSSVNPGVGEEVTARFTVKNVGGQAVSLQDLAAQVRQVPERADPAVTPVGLDFPPVGPRTLQPGESYTYQQGRSFSAVGTYAAAPAAKVGDRWGPLPGGRPVRFVVGGVVVAVR